jgi:arginase
MTTFSVAQIQRSGATQVGLAALETFKYHPVEGYWIHVDVDVLDPDVMPAVDTPTPGGLTIQELIDLLLPLLRSDLAVGLQIAVFDPDLDPDGSLAQSLTEMIATVFHASLEGDVGREAQFI